MPAPYRNETESVKGWNGMLRLDPPIMISRVDPSDWLLTSVRMQGSVSLMLKSTRIEL